jgi:positive phototaxis protein PixI
MKVADVLKLGAPAQKKMGTAHLRLRLDAQTPVAIAMAAAQAVVTIPTQRITPLPNMPKHVLGLINRRSKVLWVIDLSRMLGFAPLNLRRPELNMVFLEVDQQQLAFAVPHIEGVMRFMPEEVISPLGNFSAALVPYLQGWLPHNKNILLVLSARSLVTSPLAPVGKT